MATISNNLRPNFQIRARPSIYKSAPPHLVADAQAEVFFCTAHKSKGLQWDQVKIGSDFSFKSEEEHNLLYVACTRAMARLDLSECSLGLTN